MNDSTIDVTVYVGFLNEVLSSYTHIKDGAARGLFEIVRGVDLSDTTAKVPIERYNRLGEWLEKNFGAVNLRLAGEKMGGRLYNLMLRKGMLSTNPTPHDVLKLVKILAETAVQDPLKRGYEILEVSGKRIVMRRTQTFHPIIQEGLLKSVVVRTGVKAVRVRYLKNIRQGDEFDDYEITWL